MEASRILAHVDEYTPSTSVSARRRVGVSPIPLVWSQQLQRDALRQAHWAQVVAWPIHTYRYTWLRHSASGLVEVAVAQLSEALAELDSVSVLASEVHGQRVWKRK